MENQEARKAGGGRYRWTICGLLFFGVTINYIDRAVLSILKPVIEKDLGWDQIDYSNIVMFFQLAYAFGYVGAGRLMDLIGVRPGAFLAVLVWSLAAVGHGFVRTIAGFSAMRAVLGLSQGGAFPAFIKATAEWFPRSERAFATGVFNSGSSAGAILCPLIVPIMATWWGWQWAFILTGAIGFIWLIFWHVMYRHPESHPRLGAAELAYIRQDPPDPPARVPWSRLLTRRQTWAFVAGMVVSAPVWWFYIYWTPDFLNKRFELNLTQSSLPLMVIFAVSSLGGMAGGGFSSALLRRGRSLNAARKLAFLVCALAVVPVCLTPLVSNVWWAVALVSLAAAGHCGYAANLFTLVSDTVPRKAVSSVVGIGGMAGSLAGMGFAKLVGYVLAWTNNNYFIPFAIASLAYLAGLAVMHALLPRMEKMEPEAV